MLKVCVWALAEAVTTLSVPPLLTLVSCAWVMVNVWECPLLLDVSRDIPAAGGVWTSDLLMVIECVWPESVDDVKVFVSPVGAGLVLLLHRAATKAPSPTESPRKPVFRNSFLVIFFSCPI